MSKLQDIFGAAPKTVLNKPFMHIQDRKATTVGGGSSSAATWHKRDLNSIQVNEITGASLSSNEVTLPVGTYYVEATVPAYKVANTQAMLTDGTIELLGDTNYGGTTDGVSVKSTIKGKLIVASPSSFYINHWCDEAFATYGLGIAGTSGEDEIYTDLRIWKLDSNTETPVISDPTMTLMRPLFHAQYKLPEATTSGSTATGWNTHPLNTVVTNEIIGSSLSSNQITLPAGTYRIKGVSHARTQFAAAAKNVSRGFIRDSSDNTLLAGIPQMFEIDSGTFRLNAHHEVNGTITLTETTTITFDEYISTGAGTDGFGYPSDITGEDEIYSELFIYQLDAVRQIEAISDPNMTLKRPLLQVIAETASAISANSWQDIPLDAVIINEISGSSLNSNEITLPAGEYEVSGEAAHRSSSSPDTYIPLQAFIRTSGDTVLVSGLAVSGRNDREGVVVPIFGRFTLASTTTLKLSVYNDGVATSQAESESGRLHFADLRIYQLDALTTTPVLVNDKLYPLPGNTLVTGNMHGLEYEYTSANSVTVQPGICMDSTNKEILSLSSQVAVSIGTTINQVYNLFICKTSGGVVSIQTDTDVNGANLSAYQYIRWIGFVLNDSSGDLEKFTHYQDELVFVDGVTVVTTSSTSATRYDASSFLPLERVKMAWISISASSTTGGVTLWHDELGIVGALVGAGWLSSGNNDAAFGLVTMPYFWARSPVATNCTMSLVQLKR